MPPESSPWSVFAMKPIETIQQLARALVSDQLAIAQIRRLADALPADSAEPAAAELRARAAQAVHSWTESQLPTLAASFRLALDVLDTYGPEGVRVEDPIDAAAWNNKYFVWVKEFGG